MKIKSILIGAVSLAVALSSQAQGLITFQNTSSTLVTINGPITQGAAANATSATYGTKIQLYYQPGTVSQPAAITYSSGLGNWEAIGSLSTIASNGRFSQSGLVTGSDVAPGGTVWLIAVAWNNNYASYTAASTSDLGSLYFGTSTVFSFATGGGGAPPAPPNTVSPQLTAVTLVPVPEPTTIALAGLGAASLLLFRRRK